MMLSWYSAFISGLPDISLIFSYLTWEKYVSYHLQYLSVSGLAVKFCLCLQLIKFSRKYIFLNKVDKCKANKSFKIENLQSSSGL